MKSRIMFLVFDLNNLLPSGEKSVEGYSITIEQATRHQAGVYQCKASNGVGKPVEQSIVLHVLCKYQHLFT
ncbi:hypothetical protein RUM43_008571 [Polyplax serrata]|uniref:Immunoglobulin I-set domain-containing protein n=1 Tax=Polyplax serrata TaxID=468196 RepID=A0AAN8S1E5_POLSC